MWEYLLFFGLAFWVGIIIRDARNDARLERQRREEARQQLAAKQAAKANAVAKAAYRSAIPEPAYTLSRDAALASWERSRIIAEVGSWVDFEVDESEVIAPYEAAGDALTEDLRLAIIEDARRTEYLRRAKRARAQARIKFVTDRRTEKEELAWAEQDKSEARVLLAEFVARQSSTRNR